MKNHTTLFPRVGRQKENNQDLPTDALTALLREGAQKLLMQAVEAEVATFLEQYTHFHDERGLKLRGRNGSLPERSIQTGLGDIPIKVPRTRDRSGQGVIFSSALLPPYLKRTKSLNELLPYLYLKGLSTGDFSDALSALLGPDAKGLSKNHLGRLKNQWKTDLEAFQKRDLANKRYVSFGWTAFT